MIEMIAYKHKNGQFLCKEPTSDFSLGEDGLDSTFLYLTSVDNYGRLDVPKEVDHTSLRPVSVRYDHTNSQWKEIHSKRQCIVYYERIITQTSSYQVTADDEEEACRLSPPLNGGVTWTTLSSNTEIKHVEVLPIGTPVSPEPLEGMMGERIVKDPGWIVILWDHQKSILIDGPFPSHDKAVHALRTYRGGSEWDGRVQRCSDLRIRPDLEHIINLEA